MDNPHQGLVASLGAVLGAFTGGDSLSGNLGAHANIRPEPPEVTTAYNHGLCKSDSSLRKRQHCTVSALTLASLNLPDMAPKNEKVSSQLKRARV